MSKNEFIILSYLVDPIRVGESKNLLKTYTHSCERAKGGRGNLVVFCHCEASQREASQSQPF